MKTETFNIRMIWD